MNNRQNYPANWFDTIRPAILARDAYKCKRCGAGQRSTGYYTAAEEFISCDEHMIRWATAQRLKLYKVHLQVAHLDGNPSNNSWDNLRTLCPRHHLQYDNQAKKLLRIAAKR